MTVEWRQRGGEKESYDIFQIVYLNEHAHQYSTIMGRGKEGGLSKLFLLYSHVTYRIVQNGDQY